MKWACAVIVGMIAIPSAVAATEPPSLSSWPLRWSEDDSTLFVARSDPAIPPYGRTYAFSRDRTLVELTDEGRPGYVVPSPTGERTAVVMSGFKLVLVEPGGVRLTVAEKGSDPTWSPDGSALAYVTGDANLNGHINVYDISSRRSRELGFGFAPVWSPDGAKIAAADENYITVFNAYGDDVGGIQLSQWNGDPRSPVWSPDGTMLAFASGEGQRRGLYVSPIAFSGSRLVARRVSSVAGWSPDGSTVALSLGDSIGTVRADGRGATRMVASGVLSFVPTRDWSRSAFSVSSWHGYDTYVADWPVRNPRRVGPSQCTVVRDRCLTGSDTADRIRGGSGREVILAGAGDDTIDGRAGSDRLEGSLGRDTLSGGPDHNFVFGGAGADALRGGPHADRLDRGAGNDTLSGNSGRDSLWGGRGRDVVIGGRGDDFVVVDGDGERDRVDCGPGRDRVFADPIDVLVACERISREPR